MSCSALMPDSRQPLLDSLDGSNGVRLVGTFGDYAGSSVSGAGDVNGDGIDDVIVGAPRGDADGRYYAGASYVVFGRDGGLPAELPLDALDGNNGFRLQGAAYDYIGGSVSAAGDINGDGIDDLIMARPPSTGKVPAPAASCSAAETGFAVTVDLDGSRRQRRFPPRWRGRRSFSNAGDFNGDGIDDLVLGQRGCSGASYVVFGSEPAFQGASISAQLTGTGACVLTGPTRHCSAAGDVNGDGIDDLIIGAPDATTAGGQYAGASYVVFGFRTGRDEHDGSFGDREPGRCRASRRAVRLASKDLDIGDGQKLVGLRFTGLEIPEARPSPAPISSSRRG